MHIERLGSRGPLLLLIHGSTSPGWATWSAQRELADDFRLVVPHRSGYPPNPPLERIDFEVQAREMVDLMEPATHVVGHSYGGVIALLAAQLAPERVASLTVIEPPAFGLAREHPAVQAAIARVMAAFETPGTIRETFIRFLAAVGSRAKVPEVLTPAMEASVRATLVERFPFEAEFDLPALRRAGFPVMVVSGAHDPAADAVCDVLTRELAAERVAIPGAGHGVQRLGGPFNARLRQFVARAASGRPGTPA